MRFSQEDTDQSGKHQTKKMTKRILSISTKEIPHQKPERLKKLRRGRGRFRIVKGKTEVLLLRLGELPIRTQQRGLAGQNDLQKQGREKETRTMVRL